jgi:hypothetical protein
LEFFAGESFHVGTAVELIVDRDGVRVLALERDHSRAKGIIEVAIAAE